MANGGSLNGFTLLSNKGWQVTMIITMIILMVIFIITIVIIILVIVLMINIVRPCTRIQPQGDSALQGPRPYISLRFKNIRTMMMIMMMMVAMTIIIKNDKILNLHFRED